jgi:type IX secretion system PorP/SprF family membrane protein
MINPAVAGSDGYTSASLTAREQWVGYSGAPRTFSFSWQTRMLKKSFILKQTRVRRQVFRPKSDGKVGFGGYVFSDRNGLIQRTGFQIAYSYHMWLEKSTQLSLGLAFTGYYYKIDEKQINFEDPNEPWLNNNLRRGVFVPDMTFGAYLLNAKYSVGFSADQLSQAAAKIGGNAYKNYTATRQYYLFGSYDFSEGLYTIIQPSFLLKMSETFKPLADIGVTYIYNQGFWAGLAYRTSKALIINIGVKYQNIFFGYAYDYTLQEIQTITYGTHELTVALKFGDNTRRYRWLDRY